MSLADEGTIAQSAGPARTLSAKSDSLSVTLFFLPAMIHLPSARDTTTAGAPHSSRGSRCANDSAWQTAAKKAIRTISRGNDILPPADPFRLKAVLRTFHLQTSSLAERGGRSLISKLPSRRPRSSPLQKSVTR